MIFFKKKSNEPSVINETTKAKMKESISFFLQDEDKQTKSIFTKQIYDEMDKQCETILENEPNYVDALLAKGLLLSGRNKQKQALEYFENVLQIEPNNLSALSNVAYYFEDKNDKKSVEYVDKIVQLVKSMINNTQTSPLATYFDNGEQVKEIYTKPVLSEKHSTGAKILHAAGTGSMRYRGNLRETYFSESIIEKQQARHETNQNIRQMNESFKNELRTVRGSVLLMTNKRLIFLGYDGLPVHEIIIDRGFAEKKFNDILNEKQEFEEKIREETKSNSILGKIGGSFSRGVKMSEFYATKGELEMLAEVKTKKSLLGKEELEIKTNNPLHKVGIRPYMSKQGRIYDLNFDEKVYKILFEFLQPNADEISGFVENIKK